MLKKYIAHIDLDCFFVSVERIKNPSLNGKPVVVGGSPTGRGVVASASYEARKFGVRSAMPTAQALRLCPNLLIVGGNHKDYSIYSKKIYSRMLEIAPIVERASIDEMYLDFTGCEKLYSHNLPGFMKKIQEIIKTDFNLPCTIALASNKLVAKIAANTVKPAGIIFVPHGTEKQFLARLPIQVLPGIGPKTEEVLTLKGYHTVSDIQSVSVNRMIDLLGAHGEWLHRASLGQGSVHVTDDHVAKSISKEETFANDISDRTELEKILFEMVESVCSTLRSRNLKAKTVTLKLRSSKFETITRRQTINPANYDPVIFRAAKELLQKSQDPKIPVRLLGVGLSGFVDETQDELELFPIKDKHGDLVRAVDKLRKKYGDDSIKIGGA